ncbi:AroE Shikimate 5-dehydrogenase [Candidatus Nanopelagicaceae bacterium]
MAILNVEMQMCISIAARPSNVGTRFHNFLYEELGLNFVYKGFAVDDAEGAVRGVRALKIRGAAVSMPHKESVIPFMDEMDPSAAAIDAVNTIVNTDGYLKAYNTDYTAVVTALAQHSVDKNSSVLVRGSGGMAKAVIAAFKDSGFADLTIASRNEVTGKALAHKYGYAWLSESDLERIDARQVIVNVTPLGMSGGNEGQLSFPELLISAAEVVFEVIAMPIETPLVIAATAAGKEVITGMEIMALQAAIQFELYTGITLSEDQVRRASEFSRQPA